MSNKHNLVLYVDKELVEKSRSLGLNLSKTFENHLKHILTRPSTLDSVNNSEKAVIVVCGGPDRTRTGDLLHVKQMS